MFHSNYVPILIAPFVGYSEMLDKNRQSESTPPLFGVGISPEFFSVRKLESLGYRTALFARSYVQPFSPARRYANAVLTAIVCLSVRPSVCLSVTSRCSTKMAEPTGIG